jgi:hypothetical protein
VRWAESRGPEAACLQRDPTCTHHSVRQQRNRTKQYSSGHNDTECCQKQYRTNCRLAASNTPTTTTHTHMAWRACAFSLHTRSVLLLCFSYHLSPPPHPPPHTQRVAYTPAGCWASDVCCCALIAVIQVPRDVAHISRRVLQEEGGTPQGTAQHSAA